MNLRNITLLCALIVALCGTSARAQHNAASLPVAESPEVVLKEFYKDAGGAPATLGSAAEAPQKSFKNRYGIEMVYIPPGEFMMGSEDNDSAKPVHRVRIGYGFYMSRYEITQAQWQAAMGKLPVTTVFDFFRGHNLPVDNADFEDAVGFMNKLNKLNDGYNYRLPSEAEWEYACRAGTTGNAYGDLDKIAWSSDNSGEKTHPVGGKQPNAFGLYDMLGNVSEWCADYWHDNYNGAPTDGSKWIKGGERDFRGLYRGGSWNDEANALGSTRRIQLFQDSAPGGVRLVAVIRPPVVRK